MKKIFITFMFMVVATITFGQTASIKTVDSLIDANTITLKAQIDANSLVLKAQIAKLIFYSAPVVVTPPVVAAPIITYPSTSLSYTAGTAIATLTPTNKGGTVVSYSGALPAGLNLNTSTGVISGIPNVASVATRYTITATNAGGSSQTAITITVSAPVVVTPPGQPTYVVSGPITAQSNTTYSNLLIDLAGSSTTGIYVGSKTNVHITNCKIINGKGFGINIYGSTSVTVDDCFISNIGFGIYASQSKSIKCNSNQILNVNGINTASLGHAIQFNGVSGSGIQMNYNRVENIDGVALHPHDILNMFKVDGLPGDSAQMIGNWIRGGQRIMWPTSNSGAAGIVVGDLGGSYQVCRNNILVNPGYVGIQAQGGNHIKVDHNIIYGQKLPITLGGMMWGNWSGASSSDITYAYNQVKFYNSQGSEVDHYENNSNGTVTLIGNIWGASIDTSILPATIITMK